MGALRCKACGKTFPLAARISFERNPEPGFIITVKRVIVEKPCCVYCESIELEYVEEKKEEV